MPAPAPCAGPCINTSPPAERELGSSFHSFLYSPGLSALRAPRTLCSGRSQLVEKPLFRRIRPRVGGGARGGGSPPRMGSNAPEALLCKDSGKRSADFSAAQRRESNGIFSVCRKAFAAQNPAELGRGSPRGGRPSPSPGTKCTGSPAVQAFRRAAHKQSHFCRRACRRGCA